MTEDPPTALPTDMVGSADAAGLAPVLKMLKQIAEPWAVQVSSIWVLLRAVAWKFVGVSGRALRFSLRRGDEHRQQRQGQHAGQGQQGPS